MNAIPTKYAGVQFRSRLEARWAAFFDMVGWPWEYEPFDLPGYIPDFAVRPNFNESFMLFEVKPYTEIDEFDLEFFKIRMASVGSKNFDGFGLLTGRPRSYYLRQKDYAPLEALCGYQIGWFIDQAPDGMVSSTYWNWTPREYLSKQFFRDPTKILFSGDNMEGWQGEEAWKEAGNIVQWKVPR